jgi:hypothetical protein
MAKRRAFAGMGAALALALAWPPAAHAQSGPSHAMLQKAGWTLITASEDTYVYMRAAERAGSGVRRVWTAYDSEVQRQRLGFSFQSVESLSEFDCRRNVSRVVEERFHAGRGLTGQTWSAPNFVPTPWAAPTPGSVGAIRMAFACRALNVT